MLLRKYDVIPALLIVILTNYFNYVSNVTKTDTTLTFVLFTCKISKNNGAKEDNNWNAL